MHNLCQHLVTLTVKKYFLKFKWSFLGFGLYSLLMVLSLGSTVKSLPCFSLYYCTLYLDTLIRSSYPPDYAVPTLSDFIWCEVPSATAEAGVSISTKKVDTFLTFKPLVPLSVTQHNQHTAKHFSTVKSSGCFKYQVSAIVPRQT